MSYTPQQIEDVRAMSIAGILGKLQDRRCLMIRCPFPDHNDGTASMGLYDDNSYHCFGCNHSGRGAIDFLEDMGFSFSDVMEEYSTT